MKSKDKLREIKDMTVDLLKTKERDFYEELLWLKIKHRSGQITNFAGITKIKKDLARVKTILNEKTRAVKKGSSEGTK